MNYTNREVVRRLKQYDMFLNSFNLTTDEVQKERICDQLDKIEKQILLETNSEYEAQYMGLLSEETEFFPEEKTRLRKIISLIEDRKKYLEERKNRHKDITGSLVELTTFIGEDKLNVFKRHLEIIEKYEENKVKKEKIIKELKVIDVKLSEASRTVKANTRLNELLENKMKEIVNKALSKLNLYSLTSKKEETLKIFETLEYTLNIAKNNLKIAKSLGDEGVILECDEMLATITNEYSIYNEKINILKLIDTYDQTISSFDELLEKREKINEILKNISEGQLYTEIAEELNKQYNTIKLEKQDKENYESLKRERERKNKILYEIDEENSSKEFKQVIDEFIKNENRVHEESIRRAKKAEYEERQKKLLEEQKIEASRLRRQKLIEEARQKEQQERMKKVKELQDKTVITPKEKATISKELPKEEKINNPLENKTFEEVMSLSNTFDTEELFENTKIVPNKVINDEQSIFDDIQNEAEIEETETILEQINLPEEEISIPVWEKPEIEETEDLFKEEPEVTKEINVEEVEEKETSSEQEEKPSIYDILENNKNIIWKTTDANVSRNTIPVIGNNNLKPEILDNANITFPKIDNKEGEILWKETL